MPQSVPFGPVFSSTSMSCSVKRTPIDFFRAIPAVSRISSIRSRGAMPAVAPESGVHVCLRVKSAADVDAFHAAALNAGGSSDGAPGLRPHDRVKYYAAFVRDPDGNRIEAVTFPGE